MILTKLSVVLLIILIILPFITDARYHYFQRPKNSYHPDIINTIKFRTGDIISYTWRDYSLFDTNKIHKYKFNVINHLNEILPNLFNGKTTHIAIIICLNNVPYIYEVNDDDAYFYNKNPNLPVPRYCNFYKKIIGRESGLIDINYLKYYGGHINIIPYVGKYNPTESTVLNVINNNKMIKLDRFSSIFNECIINNTNYDSNKMTCSAFISKVLTELNILCVDKYYCILPQNIIDMCIKSGKYDSNNTIFIDNNY